MSDTPAARVAAQIFVGRSLAIQLCPLPFGRADWLRTLPPGIYDLVLVKDIEPAESADARKRLHRFLNAAAGEGFELDGVDAADLYIELFPVEYARTIASIDPDGALAADAPERG